MRQGVIYFLILIGGIGIGYTINQLFYNHKEVEPEIETVIVEKIKKQFVRDTIEIEKIIHSSIVVDTNFIFEEYDYNDSLILVEQVNSNSQPDDTEEIIFKEELISQLTIGLESLSTDSTDVSNLLEMKSKAFSKEILVEFWQSPLNITGYELSRNKLKLFGFNPNESITLRLGNEDDQLILNTDSMSLLLQKTKQFKTLRLK